RGRAPGRCARRGEPLPGPAPARTVRPGRRRPAGYARGPRRAALLPHRPRAGGGGPPPGRGRRPSGPAQPPAPRPPPRPAPPAPRPGLPHLRAGYELLAALAAGRPGRPDLLAWERPWRRRYRRATAKAPVTAVLPAYAALAWAGLDDEGGEEAGTHLLVP